MTVGDRIRKQRELMGLSQTELAEKAKISKQTLYKYETNIVTNIPSDKIENMAQILTVSPAYLMGWEDSLTTANADLVVDILSDKDLILRVEKLRDLSREHRQTVFDNIDYWYEKEGH